MPFPLPPSVVACSINQSINQSNTIRPHPHAHHQGLTPTALQIIPRMGLSFSVFERLEARGAQALARAAATGGQDDDAAWIGEPFEHHASHRQEAGGVLPDPLSFFFLTHHHHNII